MAIVNKCRVLTASEDDEGDAPSLARQVINPKARAGIEMGIEYGRIVRMCLDCDFGLGLASYSLDNEQLQRAFYVRVVRQFQELLPSWEKIYGLPIGFG